MGKDMNLGGISVKQSGGAHVFTNIFTNLHFSVSPTGGVPTWPTGVDMYLYKSKSVAMLVPLNGFVRVGE